MSLIINHNLMAMNAARNLGVIYGKLATSTQRLSSGLRINSAADDAAGLAIRELMRADIAVLNQGLRNASDAISMIQTAEGALSVIDEKLTRMKELAEQAATGTYTTAQREIMNSEYQAMAREIDRIASATDFNGIKLIDGSMSNLHGGQGVKVHFGVGNLAAEDYYFVNMGDARATVSTGLKVGGDGKNDIWGQAGTGGTGAAGCCGGGISSLSAQYTLSSGDVFAYGYNWDWKTDTDANLTTGKYVGGMYQVTSGHTSLQDLIDAVNKGTQSRIKIALSGSASTIVTSANDTSAANRVCLGDEIYYLGSAGLATVTGKTNIALSSAGILYASALTRAINTSSQDFWALQTSTTVYVFSKEGGDYNSLIGCDEQLGIFAGSATIANRVTWANVETDATNNSGTTFSLGGEFWGLLKPVQTAVNKGYESWGVTLNGRDVGTQRDLYILNVGSGTSYDINTGSGMGFDIGTASLSGFDRYSFTEIQNAANGGWAGAEIRTQSAAQESLDALADAIVKKDKIRADLGSLQNRLENTITNLTIQAENLQAAESRISDVDVATEMTEFTKNNILAQAATSMLAQANSLAQLALSLLGR
ncbi:MAG: flagellin [Thermodesulfobacteriota bacterium]